MVEQLNSKRAFLPKKQQIKFINKILSKIPIKKAAKLCSISERTIRDWRRGKFSMNLKKIQKLCKTTNTPFLKNIKTKNRYWYAKNGSSAGGLAVFKKYGRIGGEPKYRKKKWFEWWNKEGKFKKHPIINVCLPVEKPKKSDELAEFIGILIGDGGITKRQITITLNHIDDKEYGKFVIKLIKKLFNITPSVYHDTKNSINDIVISRSELVKFFVSLGLPIGNKIKQQIDIPEWIKANKLYSIGCIRGLVDTDGCIFNHKYKVKGRWYSYKKLAFASYSKPLRESVFNILRNNELNPRLAQERDVRLDSVEDMKKYFKIFGSHNPKHLRKYHK